MTEENRADVVQLCLRLDGMPLAIELAAVKLRVLSPRDLVERLDRRFSVLVGGSSQRPLRHQTLRALVDWSFERCTAEEQLLWARLSVFPAGFSLRSAERACSAGEGLSLDRVLDVLEGLVSRSLMVVDRSGPSVRYSQLGSIRDYGLEFLAARGETDAMLDALLMYCLNRSRDIVRAWCGPGQTDALRRWSREHITLQTAIEWGCRGPTVRTPRPSCWSSSATTGWPGVSWRTGDAGSIGPWRRTA